MHSVAEYGVAAHWNYNDPSSEENVVKFKWIQELVGILDEEEQKGKGNKYVDEFEHSSSILFHN